MLCTSCGFENPEGMNFCGKCAAPLSHSCPKCGFENPPAFAFCGKCSAPLNSESTESEITQRSEQSQRKEYITAPEAERRQLTVMFCDLVGSTPLAEQLDPEELREEIRSYQEVCAEVIDRFDGYIAQYLGDGLLVYFGYPLSHEDDAQRAVKKAGLEIVGAVGAISEPTLQNKHLQQSVQVRIGIHTGLVVAGEMGRGNCTDAPGHSRPSGHGGRAGAVVFSYPASRGLWKSWADRSGTHRADRGAGCGKQNWGTFL